MLKRVLRGVVGKRNGSLCCRRSITFQKAENRIVQHYREEQHREWKGEFHFVFITDPQLGFINQVYEHGDGTTWQEEIDNIEKAVTKINNMKPLPKFVCIGGDMINAYPKRGDKLRTIQAVELKKAFRQLDANIPIFCVSGNHDIGNYPDLNSMKWYHQHFGDDFYSFWYSGVLFLVLNSQYMKFPSRIHLDDVNEQQKWLRNLLDRIGNYSPPPKHIVIFMHIPIFFKRFEEENHPCSLPVDIRRYLLNELAQVNAQTVFCGHLHVNNNRVWTSSNRKQTIEIQISAAIGCPLGKDPAGFRSVFVKEDQITHEYIKVGSKNARDYKRLNKGRFR